jgi:hypothetical protein
MDDDKVRYLGPVFQENCCGRAEVRHKGQLIAGHWWLMV